MKITKTQRDAWVPITLHIRLDSKEEYERFSGILRMADVYVHGDTVQNMLNAILEELDYA